MTNIKKGEYNLPLTVILVQDPVDKGFTAFPKHFPNIIAEGDDEKSAIKNLFDTMNVAFEDQSKIQSIIPNDTLIISEKEINLTSLEYA